MTMNTHSALDTMDQLGFFTDSLEVNSNYLNQPIKYDKLSDLTRGDLIKVTLRNGYTSEGIYAFYGDRVSVRETTYFFEKKVSHYGGRPKVIEGRCYAEFSEGDQVQILSKNYAPDYQLPNKSAVYPKLVEELKSVPLNKRIETYRLFCQSYPQYEVTWHRLLNDVWDYAIAEVTTPEEVEEMIMTEKKEHGRYYEPFVKPFLDYVFENIEPSQRFEYIKGCAWSKVWYHRGLKKKHRSLNTFTTNMMSDGVYAKLLAVTNDKKVFNKLFDVWGVQSRGVSEEDLLKKYYLVESAEENSGLWLDKSLSIDMKKYK
ncbi:hypothetical protein O0Q50_22715 [Priestia aryabhattai]|uniref:Uncharacterized protein n=1 Tax=Priestia aryabhattai TaxID=412384 RepID=A0AAX6NDM6_PRIAR|nr:hypothetical protein [Priestia aryabhattai]MDU9693998.1 hypothetical protein [Priestia aryabhattai]